MTDLTPEEQQALLDQLLNNTPLPPDLAAKLQAQLPVPDPEPQDDYVYRNYGQMLYDDTVETRFPRMHQEHERGLDRRKLQPEELYRRGTRLMSEMVTRIDYKKHVPIPYTIYLGRTFGWNT